MSFTVDDVCRELTEMKMEEQYIHTFREQQIDGAVLSFMNEDGLKQLNIQDPLQRARILGFVARMKNKV